MLTSSCQCLATPPRKNRLRCCFSKERDFLSSIHFCLLPLRMLSVRVSSCIGRIQFFSFTFPSFVCLRRLCPFISSPQFVSNPSSCYTASDCGSYSSTFGKRKAAFLLCRWLASFGSSCQGLPRFFRKVVHHVMLKKS